MRRINWPLWRDWAIYGASLLAVGASLGALNLDPRWQFSILVLAIMVLNFVIKLVMPKHAVLARLSWIYIALTGVLLAAVALLWANPSYLGGWTIPALIVVTLVYWQVHSRFGPR